MRAQDLKNYIKDYPDFPKDGIIFRDISPLLADPKAFAAAVEMLTKKSASFPNFDKIVAIDARGFIFGGALADRLHKGLVLCRKGAKLPGDLLSQNFGYEYSTDLLSIKKESIKPGERFLIVDDVLATGNTILAAYKIIKNLGGRVSGILCLIELSYIDGRKLLKQNIKDINLESVLEISS